MEVTDIKQSKDSGRARNTQCRAVFGTGDRTCTGCDLGNTSSQVWKHQFNNKVAGRMNRVDHGSHRF